MPWYLRNLMARGGYMEAETGAEEGGAAGAGESPVQIGESPDLSKSDDPGPSSMLEAIESGLKVETEAEKTERLRDELTTAGCDVTFVPFRGGHEIPMPVIKGLEAFLRRVLPV